MLGECFIKTSDGLYKGYITNMDTYPNETRFEGVIDDLYRYYAEGFRRGKIPGFTYKTVVIEDVIFNDPATIVKWSDGTKTVVKCQPGDTYDKEIGLAMCISKKFFGNKGNYNEVFKKWIPDEDTPKHIDYKSEWLALKEHIEDALEEGKSCGYDSHRDTRNCSMYDAHNRISRIAKDIEIMQKTYEKIFKNKEEV